MKVQKRSDLDDEPGDRSRHVTTEIKPDFFACREDDDYQSALRIMRDNNLVILPVMDDERRVVGFLKRGEDEESMWRREVAPEPLRE